MHARRAQPNQHVAARNGPQPRQQLVALDSADTEPAEVIMPWRVHAWHLGRLSSHEGTAALLAAGGDRA